MLTYHITELKDQCASYWLSTAVHYAKAAGAHLYSSNNTSARVSLKRLWWCCVLRDKIMVLALRQSPLFSQHNYDTESEGLDFGDLAHEIHGSRVYDAHTKRLLIQLPMVLCELSMILSQIPLLLSSDTTRGFQRYLLSTERIASLLNSLDSWYETTHEKFRLSMSVSDAVIPINLFTNVVFTYYQ